MPPHASWMGASIFGAGSLLAIPFSAAGLLVGTYPTRIRVLEETWSLPTYLYHVWVESTEADL
jgi:hypothetical protein